MGRPETYDDLSTYARMPIEVASFDLSECAEVPLFLTSLLLAAEVAGYSGKFETAVENQKFYVRRPRTDEELNTELKAAQGSWDRAAQHYAEWRKDSTRIPPKYVWHTVRSYYRAMGTDPIPELETANPV